MNRQDAVLVGAEHEENLALRYLGAAATQAGYQVGLHPYAVAAGAETAARSILRGDPRLVGLSITFQAGVPSFFALARELRAQGFRGHLVAGGQFATVAARRLLELSPEIDSVGRGEGEGLLVELLRAVNNGGDLSEIRGLTYRADPGASGAADSRAGGGAVSGIGETMNSGVGGESSSSIGETIENPPRPATLDLDALPRPLRTPPFGRQAGLPVASMLASRGCTQGCTYCSIQTFGRQRPGPRHRMREVDAVVGEMADLHRDHGVRIFIFHDDNFLCPRPRESEERAAAFAAALRERVLAGVSLVIKIRPDVVTDEIVTQLREAGVVRAYVGIESGNPHGLKVLGRGHGIGANHRALDAFERGGVFACYNLLAFHPETRLDEVREDLAFARAHPFAPLNVGRVEIYAGTPLDRWLRRRQRLWGPELAPQYRITDPQAELASRITAIVFGRRAFHLEGLLNGISSLGYEPAVIRRAHPDRDLGSLPEEARELTRDVTLDSCSALEDICRLAETASGDPERVHAGVRDLAWDVARRDLELELRLRSMRDRLHAAGA